IDQMVDSPTRDVDLLPYGSYRVCRCCAVMHSLGGSRFFLHKDNLVSNSRFVLRYEKDTGVAYLSSNLTLC
ncbi:hypothetical protein M378DRAFT_171891, partial [Amanita muscaria Koide BX008]